MNSRRRTKDSSSPPPPESGRRSGEESKRPTTSVPPRSGARAARQRPRILVADSRQDVRAWVRPALDALRPEIVELDSCKGLELALFGPTSVDLVVTSSQLGDGSTLQVLARARARGAKTPFIVHTSFQRNLLRVFVSDTQGTVLSSRVVDAENLADLATRLIKELHAEPSV